MVTKRISKKTTVSPTAEATVTSIKYLAKRSSIPPIRLEAQGFVPEAARICNENNPHLPAVLRYAADAPAADSQWELLMPARQRALSMEAAKVLPHALARHEPRQEWSGKLEKPWFEVEPLALHMHQRVSTQAILHVPAREDVERDRSADPQDGYDLFGRTNEREYEPLLHLVNGHTLLVENRGRKCDETDAKIQAPCRRAMARDHWGRLGQWDFLPCWGPTPRGAEIRSMPYPVGERGTAVSVAASMAVNRR